ncbi:ABC transporter substrate-binding protein [Aestuariirhabdus sp. LZHN29]|uniref:ABC transporter substrate-binding protein n=1 Tax=Aestuariirhabdus sp. LZHN29 TaxID=3417462 RepID=UPI003CF140F0
MIKRLFAIGATVVALAATPAMAKEWNKVRIGVEGAYPPFSQTNPDGSVTGFDIDVANALCAAMNAECTMVKQDWDGIIPALLARKYDAIIASMSITEERKQKVDFTKKYYTSPLAYAAKKGAGIDTSNLAGKTVGVQRSTIADTYISNAVEGVNVKRYGTQDEAYLDIKAGRLDLLVADVFVLTDGFLSKEGGDAYELVGDSITDAKWVGEGIGIAVRKRDKDLTSQLNAAIDKIRADGTYDKIRKQYFEFEIY